MNKKVKYLVLGAGPAGLTIGNKLKESEETSFLVVEKESEAGGLCRSADIDKAPLDIGGGHFLDVRREEVNNFLFHFMPKEEWEHFERDSRIAVGEDEIGHPFEANIWQFTQEKQVKYLKSIALAGCNLGKPIPEKFIDWIEWKLGKCIAEDYMLPYNRKMFGDNLNELGTYWLEKLPDVSFEETLLSCLNRKAYGKQPGHAQFYYPKAYGYGEVWKRMGNALGDHIAYGCAVERIDFEAHVVKVSTGDQIYGENIITTIPWTSFEKSGMPETLENMLKKLKYSSVEITYYPESMNTEAQWIYYPDAALEYHRILVRGNFYKNASGYWTETNSDRYTQKEQINFHNEYAYPLNTIEKPQIMGQVLAWAEQHKIYGLGRWGEWEHYNSDAVVERAMELADRCMDL